jgi:hypothetical protein
MRRTRPKSQVRSACYCCCCCAPSSTLVADASPVAACCVDLHCLPTARSVVPCRTTAFAKASEQPFAYFFPLSAGGRMCERNECVSTRVEADFSQPDARARVQPHNEFTIKKKSETRWQEGNKYRLQVHVDIVQQLRSSSSIRQATHRRQVLHGMREVAASKGRAEVSSAAARQRHTSH